MRKNKKLGIIIGIIAVIFCFGIVAYGLSKTSSPIVKDNEPQIPTESHILTAELKQGTYEVAFNEEFDISQVDMNIKADSDTKVQFADGTTTKSYDTLGAKTEAIDIIDSYNNTEIVEITIDVVDTNAPVITGVSNCSIMETNRFKALGGVSATDDVDGNVSNTLTCTDYNINTIGTQIITITATDNSGNVASVDFTLTINEQPVVIVEAPVQAAQSPTRDIFDAPLDGIAHNITCWGDSLTAGTGASKSVTINNLVGPTMPSTLASLTGRKVNNMGVYGEDSRTIVCRQGGLPMYINNLTIPAKGSVKFDQIMCKENDQMNEVYPCRFDWNGQQDCFNPCIISGIAGTLTYDPNIAHPYTFTRATDGSELIINSDTQIITQASIDFKDDILILQIGNNGGWNWNTETLIAQYDAIIAQSQCKYYIIVGDTDNSAAERVGWEGALQWAFGKHFINMREYLSQNGLNECGLTPTKQDLELMATGAVPYSLKAPDESHLTSYGYWVEGNVIYKKGVELGYWN